jgi:peroxiredoxin
VVTRRGYTAWVDFSVRPPETVAMSISVGDSLPDATFKVLGDDGVKDVTTADVFGGKKVVLFGLPGAFTGTCSKIHLPGYVEKADEIRAKGVDDIVCLAVNDPFVMQAWAEAQGAVGKVSMLSDWDASFTRALGLDVDISVTGLGVRTKRFSAIVEDGVVKKLDVEPGRGVVVSGADVCIAAL